MELIEIEDRLDKQTIIYDFVPLTIESKEISLYIDDRSRGDSTAEISEPACRSCRLCEFGRPAC